MSWWHLVTISRISVESVFDDKFWQSYNSMLSIGMPWLTRSGIRWVTIDTTSMFNSLDSREDFPSGSFWYLCRIGLLLATLQRTINEFLSNWGAFGIALKAMSWSLRIRSGWNIKSSETWMCQDYPRLEGLKLGPKVESSRSCGRGFSLGRPKKSWIGSPIRQSTLEILEERLINLITVGR